MVNRQHLAKGLAFAFLAGAWTEQELLARGLEALGDGPSAVEGIRWLRRVVQRVMRDFPALPIDREDELNPGFGRRVKERLGRISSETFE